MKIALCILIILFGGLSMLAAITQLKAARNRRSPMVMTVGSALLLPVCRVCKFVSVSIE